MEQPLLGKINTLTEKNNFSVVKNDTHKIRGLHRIKIKTWYKMSAGSGVSPGSKSGTAAETVQKRQKQYMKKWRNKKMNVVESL